MKTINTVKEAPQKRLAEYLKKVKTNKPVISSKTPTGKSNRSDKGLRDD